MSDLEKFRQTMDLDVLRSWGADAQQKLDEQAAEIERLQADANMLQWLIDRAAMSYPSGEGSDCKDAWREHGNEIVRAAIMDEMKGPAMSCEVMPLTPRSTRQ